MKKSIFITALATTLLLAAVPAAAAEPVAEDFPFGKGVEYEIGTAVFLDSYYGEEEPGMCYLQIPFTLTNYSTESLQLAEIAEAVLKVYDTYEFAPEFLYFREYIDPLMKEDCILRFALPEMVKDMDPDKLVLTLSILEDTMTYSLADEVLGLQADAASDGPTAVLVAEDPEEVNVEDQMKDLMVEPVESVAEEPVEVPIGVLPENAPEFTYENQDELCTYFDACLANVAIDPEKLVGTWVVDADGEAVSLVLNDDGTYTDLESEDQYPGYWEYTNNMLMLRNEDFGDVNLMVLMPDENTLLVFNGYEYLPFTRDGGV